MEADRRIVPEPGARDLAAPELWERSLRRSHIRRHAAARRRSPEARARARRSLVVLGAAAVASGPSAASAQAAAGGLLHFGSHGPGVARVQRALRISADGSFGAATRRAVRGFQARHGLTVDGVVGPRTRAALRLATGLARQHGVLSIGARGPAVALAQRALGVRADGVFGPHTAAAVRSFQARHGLAVDGAVGPQTRAALARGGRGVRQARRHGRLGGRAAEVRAVQRHLGISVDGIFGPVTQGAVRAFQARHGLIVDGVVGPQTLRTLGLGRYAGRAPLRRRSGRGGLLLSRPLNGPITSYFGEPRANGGHHQGIDIGAFDGTPIRSAAAGRVSLIETTSFSGGYGNFECVAHTAVVTTCYAHLSRFGTSYGAYVGRGEVIGYVGHTGDATGPHLHFEVRVRGVPVNPLRYLP